MAAMRRVKTKQLNMDIETFVEIRTTGNSYFL